MYIYIYYNNGKKYIYILYYNNGKNYMLYPLLFSIFPAEKSGVKFIIDFSQIFWEKSGVKFLTKVGPTGLG